MALDKISSSKLQSTLSYLVTKSNRNATNSNSNNSLNLQTVSLGNTNMQTPATWSFYSPASLLSQGTIQVA